MLPKKYRLTKREFQTVRDHGQLQSGRLLAILVAREPENQYPKAGLPAEALAKAGLIVSKKLDKRAVIRNRLKRRLRAALMEILPNLPGNIRIIVLPNRKALDATVKELEEDLKKLTDSLTH